MWVYESIERVCGELVLGASPNQYIAEGTTRGTTVGPLVWRGCLRHPPDQSGR
jgi:hypothetical protein